MKRALFALLVFSIPVRASAWEGMCRFEDEGGEADRVSRATLETTICEHDPDDAQSGDCEPGLQWARGIQRGEHTLITRAAMEAAKIDEEMINRPVVFKNTRVGLSPDSGYYTGGQVFRDTGLESLEPAGAGGVRKWVDREVTIPELSELADGASSFSEFILGNEHCIPENLPRSTVEDLNSCHTFTNHLGAVNSTHWPPLSREMYRIYHQAAITTAERCKKMKASIPPGTHLLREHMIELAKACDREALALQSHASHFLEDAWSSGHMFVRWGPPSFPETTEEHLQATIAAMVVGIIHGSKSVTGNDDQACMPGPTDTEKHPQDFVQWRPPGGPVHAGGGDLYLRACPEREEDRRFGSVSEGTELEFQYRRMLTCVAHGFREVHDASQPQKDESFRWGPEVDEVVPASDLFSLSGDCWNQRLTNRSMLFGLGATRFFTVTAEDFADPGFFTRLGLDWAVEDAEELAALGVTPEIRERESLRFRHTLTLLARIYKERSDAAPEGTDIANMTVDGRPDSEPILALRHVFGLDAAGRPIVDWNRAHLETLERDGVQFLERHEKEAWSAAPTRPNGCARDENCMPGEYCDPTAVDSSTVTGRCVRHEAAILRAFRSAETPHWCAHETWDELNAARRACRELGAQDACAACTDIVLPRLRNACDAGPEGFPESSRDSRGSVCDHYVEHDAAMKPDPTHAFVHFPYEQEENESPWEARVRAARQACLAGAEELTRPVADYGFSDAPPADAEVIAIGQRESSFRPMCGLASNPVHWWRYRSNGLGSAVVNIELRPSMSLIGGGITGGRYPYLADVGDLELVMLRGPRCDPAQDEIAEGVPQDLDGDGDFDQLRMSWAVRDLVVDQICLRVSARHNLVRTGYTLRVGTIIDP